jgi:FkbM family methyltransferase
MDQALDLGRWINELGGCKEHSLVMIYDQRCPDSMNNQIRAEFTKAFGDYYSMKSDAAIDGWPEGANYFFRILNAYVESKPVRYWFWLEPDAVPLKPGWLDDIQAEFIRGNKPFMGDRVDLPDRPDVPLHMSGIGVYPNPLYKFAGESYRAHDIAWDIAGKDQIVPRAHFTKIIQHYWKHPEFTEIRDIRPEAVIFHASKDGSLIRLLRRKKSGEGDTPVVSSMYNGKEPDKPGSPSSLPTSFPRPDQLHAATHPGPVDAYYFGDQGIKKMENGIWILEGDTIIGGQILAENRLDIDKLIPKILPYIRPGDSVIDVGAFVGDHTVSYAQAVGEHGHVYAFEPNPKAAVCLRHNTAGMHNVSTFERGLSDKEENVPLSSQAWTPASARVGDDMKIADVWMNRLDDLDMRPDLIKIDVEGYELKVLRGAAKTIQKHHPIMVIEINPEALARQGYTPDQIFVWLEDNHYRNEIIIDYRPQSDWYDIVALPAVEPSGKAQVKAQTPAPKRIDDSASASIPPPQAPLTPYGEMIAAVLLLKRFADVDTNHRMRVMQNLRHNGLTPRWPTKKKKKKCT